MSASSTLTRNRTSAGRTDEPVTLTRTCELPGDIHADASARAFVSLFHAPALALGPDLDPETFAVPFRDLLGHLPGWLEEGQGSGNADPSQRLVGFLRSISDADLTAIGVNSRTWILSRLQNGVDGRPITDPLEELAACRRAHDDATDLYLVDPAPAPFPVSGPGRAEPPVPGDRRGPEIVTASAVEPEQVRWWWRGRLALGKLTVLEGEPDVGKSTVLLDLAARISTGRPMPDGTPAPEGPGDVLILAASEDGLADTIVPRLTSAGADLERVHIWRGTPAPGGYLRGFELERDLAELEEELVARRVRMVIVDALMAAMPGGQGTNRDPDVRRLLHPLAALAERTGAVIALNRHHRKGAGKAIERGGGSIAIGAVARAVLAVVKDDNDETGERRLLGVVKANLLPEAEKSSMAYRIIGATVTDSTGREVETSRIEWLGNDERRIRDLLARSDDETGGGEAGECAQAIRALLADGPMPAKDAEGDLRGQGFSPATIRRARDRVPVTRGAGTIYREGFGRGGIWWWRLPPPEGQNEAPAVGAHPPMRTYADRPDAHLFKNPAAMRDPDPSGGPALPISVHPIPMSTYGAEGTPGAVPLDPDDPSPGGVYDPSPDAAEEPPNDDADDPSPEDADELHDERDERDGASPFGELCERVDSDEGHRYGSADDPT